MLCFKNASLLNRCHFHNTKLLTSIINYQLSIINLETHIIKCEIQSSNSRFASFASFCDVWWIPSPILDALLLNSDWIATADRVASTLVLLPLLEDATLFADENDFFNLSATLKNSCVRSLYDVFTGAIIIFVLYFLSFFFLFTK